MTNLVILGLLSVTGAAGTLPQTATTLLLYPWESAQGPVTVPEAGDYTLWISISPRAASSVTVAGKQFDLPEGTKEEQKAGTSWRQAGSIKLPAGPVTISCGSDISLIALSRQPGYAPESVLSDIRALSLPKSARDLRAETERDTNTVFTMPHYGTLLSQRFYRNVP